MINTLVLFRRARLLVFVVVGLFMVIFPIIGLALLIVNSNPTAHDVIQVINNDGGISTLMCMIMVATLANVDSKHGMVRYYVMTGEQRMRHIAVRVASSIAIWGVVAVAMSLVILLFATAAGGSHDGLSGWYVNDLVGRLATSAIGGIAAGALTTFTRNAGIAVGVGIVWGVVIDNVLLNLPFHWIRGWHHVSLAHATQALAHSSNHNSVVDGIVVAGVWLSALCGAAIVMEQRRDL